jgi:hypothetical protein
MEVSFELGMGAVVIAFDGAIYALDRAIGPGVIGLGQAVFDAMFEADQFEGVDTQLGNRAASVSRRIAKLDAVVGQDRVYGIRNGHDEVLQKGDGHFTLSPIIQLGISKLFGAVKADDQHRSILTDSPNFLLRPLYALQTEMMGLWRASLRKPAGVARHGSRNGARGQETVAGLRIEAA